MYDSLLSDLLLPYHRMFNPFRPTPAPPGFGQGKEIPEGDAS